MADPAGHEPPQATGPPRAEKIDSTLALAIGVLSAISGFASLLITIQNFLNGSHVRQSFGAGLATVVLVAGALFFLTRSKREHDPLWKRSTVISAVIALLLVAGGVTLAAWTTNAASAPAPGHTTTTAGAVYYSGDLTYDGSSSGQAYDLDYNTPAPFGPNNTLMLNTNEIDVVVVPHGAKAAPSWIASSLPDKQRCVNLLAQAPGDFPGIYQNLTLGTTFCFQTAAGRYGALRVIDASTHYTVSVVVWS